MSPSGPSPVSHVQLIAGVNRSLAQGYERATSERDAIVRILSRVAELDCTCDGCILVAAALKLVS